MSIDDRREQIANRLETLRIERLGDKFQYPSVLALAKNLAQSAGDVLAAPGDFKVEEEEFLDRLEICLDCDLLDPVPIRCTHESCGCFLKIKAHLGAVTCPLYMWPGDAEKVMLGLETDDE